MVVNIQDDILKLHAMGLLSRLLQDKATRGSILWATDAYAHQGDGYSRGNEIRPQRITGENSDLIKTRARRAMEQRTERTRQHAEVFTPFWIVKKMCDVADEEWFGRKDGFWKTDDVGHISFPAKRSWKHYIDARRMEITCGEAPFLATRYDVETGEAIPVEDRIGLLDRKLRAVSENVKDLDEWKTWALRAVQATYGYELQGDNLLIARVNLLCSVEEHMFYRWRQKPDKAWMEKLCNVISWNLWQMDGIKGCVPVPPKPTEEQLCLFPPDPQFGLENLFGEKEEEIICRLFDWRGDHSICYKALREKGPELMKFDFIIGNPPYQVEPELGSTRSLPIYDKFMDESYKISKKVELITPARFLFNAGQTKKEWNLAMLSNPHLKVLHYEADSSKVFPSTDIMGGIAITYYDSTQTFRAIGTFVTHPELRSIITKAAASSSEDSVASIAESQNNYNFDELYKDHPDYTQYISGEGHHSQLKTNALSRVPIFTESKQNNDDLRIFGLVNAKRCYRYCPKRYIRQNHPNLYKYKVLIPAANGSPAISDGNSTVLIGEPIVADPNVGYTQSFMSIGSFENTLEAENAMKYVKTRFCRTLLGVLKVTQSNPPVTWRMVPIQNFTSASDIDWSKSIPEIDQQFYTKYGLDDGEIAFIESHVKEMS